MVKSAESRLGIESDLWTQLQGRQIVIDVSSPFVFIGTLVELRGGFLTLTDVDAHDLRDTSTTRDQYVRQVRLHGVNVNRSTAWVRLGEVVAISELESVVVD